MTDHTPTPWHWVIHDSSMATIEGPRSEWDHVLSISPCKHCQGEDWKWGSCTVASEADADFIIKAVNSHDALVKFAQYVLEMDPESDAPLFAKAREALAQASGLPPDRTERNATSTGEVNQEAEPIHMEANP